MFGSVDDQKYLDDNDILLVVDDEVDILRTVKRIFRKNFKEIRTTRNIDDAVSELKKRDITHLLCDYWIGDTQFLGTKYALKWKKLYPSIKKIILFTGSNIDTINKSPGVDAVLSKTTSAKILLKNLKEM
jgi:DNA-binding NtrC family response regulator